MLGEEVEEKKPGFNTENCVVIAKIAQFSNESVHAPGRTAVLAEYVVNSESFWKTFLLEVYPNVRNPEKGGFVSLFFECTSPVVFQVYKYFEFSCTVSVIDMRDSKRFLRSFTFPYDPNWRAFPGVLFTSFDVQRYISRETLLTDTLDLLPEDYLTLHIDVHFKTVSAISEDDDFQVEDIIEFAFQRETPDGVNSFLLSLDSKLADRLRDESAYFRRISNTPMKEGVTRYMEIPGTECLLFEKLCYLVMGVKNIVVTSILYICRMYILADKYDIPAAVEICGHMLDSFFLCARTDRVVADDIANNISVVCILADIFGNTRVKELAENFSNNMEEDADRDPDDPQGDQDSDPNVKHAEKGQSLFLTRPAMAGSKRQVDGFERVIEITEDTVESEWNVIPVEYGRTLYFVLSKDVPESEQSGENQNPEYDFYQ